MNDNDQNDQNDLPNEDEIDGPDAPVPDVPVEQLWAEVESLRRGLLTRELTGQATGLLAAWLSITTDQAWQIVSGVSNHTNLRAREVARLLVDSANDAVAGEADQEQMLKIADAIDIVYARHIRPAAPTPPVSGPAV
ncbi:ANTAR domain-containing protein [Kineosporia sp. J2-2]|uniref:ANTAR domain-containing protein n=1 Tax=Kineosporia corallincola TaxID=2835133 RepID=A0ABS5TS64_9ACTN|nr:ANTAR domain-containing protein [Kineosporia corallincola]MBT0773651.1 ANTAR domain-containing protein [Kineosporia corallincola]